MSNQNVMTMSLEDINKELESLARRQLALAQDRIAAEERAAEIQPEITEYNNRVLPIIIENLNNASCNILNLVNTVYSLFQLNIESLKVPAKQENNNIKLISFVLKINSVLQCTHSLNQIINSLAAVQRSYIIKSKVIPQIFRIMSS